MYVLKRSWVAFVDGNPVCSAFCFVDDSKYCAWLAYVTMNPAAKTAERSAGFTEMMAEIESSLKFEGVQFIYAPANNPSLIVRYKNAGFTTSDLDVVDMCKVLTKG